MHNKPKASQNFHVKFQSLVMSQSNSSNSIPNSLSYAKLWMSAIT